MANGLLGVIGAGAQSAEVQKALEEQRFREWYGTVAKKLGIGEDPDDPEHKYDYRAFFRDMQAGKVVSPDQPGGHFPSTYKLAGHPRAHLQDRRGRVFDTRSASYLDGTSVPREELDASEEAPDMPDFDPAKASLLIGGMRGRR